MSGEITVRMTTDPAQLNRMGRLLMAMAAVFAAEGRGEGLFAPGEHMGPEQPQSAPPPAPMVPQPESIMSHDGDFTGMDFPSTATVGQEDPAGIDFAAIQEAIAVEQDIGPVGTPTNGPMKPASVDPNGPPPPTTVELDRDGMPWDRRIHSSSHAMCKDGTWKLMRGSDPKLVEQVRAEHRRAAAPAPVAPAAAPAPAAQVVAPAPAAAPAPVAPAAAPASTGAMTWPEFVTKVQTSNPRVSPVELNAACVKHGVDKTILLASHPEKIPLVAAELWPVVQ